MRVLFVASGNHGKISPVVKAQGDSLAKAGIEVDYFLIKGKGIKGYLGQIMPLRRYWKNGNFDVVHAHFSFSSYVASLARVKPLVVSLMGSDLKATRWNAKMIRFFSRVFHWKDIIVKSRDMANDLQIPGVHIVPNGVDAELFVPMDNMQCRQKLGWKENKKHVLFPANPARAEKDYPLALNVFSLVGDEVQLHVFENVEHSNTVYYYNAADAVLLTSKWEGSPNVIKEALACGCPIVSVDVGDVRERIQGVEGCYVAATREPKDIAELLNNAMSFEGKTNGREKLISDGLDNQIVVRKLFDMYYKTQHCMYSNNCKSCQD